MLEEVAKLSETDSLWILGKHNMIVDSFTKEYSGDVG